jgi:hypothetical protein
MSQPFSGIPDPGTPRPFKRSIQPGVIENAMRGALRLVKPYSRDAVREAKRYGSEAWRRSKRASQELWGKGRRNPRAVALAGGAAAVTLVGAIAVSATGAGRSLCPPASEGKAPPFLLLMDPVPPAASGREMAVNYDVCGLPSGTSYSGRVRLSQQKAGGKKAAKSKPLVVTFKDKSDGPATRREKQLALRSVAPAAYSLELTVIDDQGRVRKKVQKVLVRKS